MSEWQHIAVTYADNTARVYVNGALESEQTLDHGPLAYGSGPVNVGFLSYNDSRFFDGIVDEFAVWKSALNLTRINALVENGLCGGPFHTSH